MQIRQNGLCQWRVLYFHFMSLFWSNVGLGLGKHLSLGRHVYLVVDIAISVLYGVLAPVTQRSVIFLEEHNGNELKTVKANSEMGNGSASNCIYYSEGPVFAQASVPWHLNVVMRIPVHR